MTRPDPRDIDLATITNRSVTEVPRWKTLGRTGEFSDGPPTRGVSDLVAVALIALNLDTVQRSTIRALCPKQDGGRHGDPISAAFRRALRKFEHFGWINREGALIHVQDREAMCAWVALGVDVTDERAATLLAVREAVRQINDAEAVHQHAEVRRRELIALQRLMQAIPAGTARPGVRIVPRGRAL
jgi:hypothetical protein